MRYTITHSLLSSWLHAMKENPNEDATSERNPAEEFMQALRRELKVEVKTADPLRRDVLKNMQELGSELRMAFAEYDSK